MINAILIAMLYGVGLPDTTYDTTYNRCMCERINAGLTPNQADFVCYDDRDDVAEGRWRSERDELAQIREACNNCLSSTDRSDLARGYRSLDRMQRITDSALGVARHDTVYLIEVGYEHEVWFERDTVESWARPRRSGSLWYVPLIDGRDVWCDRARILSKRSR